MNISFLNGKYGGNCAKGFAVFPIFIVLGDLEHPMTQQWLNHESIHIQQFLESFGLFWTLSKLEYLYARIFLKYSHIQAYRYEAMEQEAYLNQENLNYLKERKLFSTWKYFKQKKLFHTDSSYRVIVD